MIELRTPAEIDQMAAAGEFVASVLQATAAASRVSSSTLATNSPVIFIAAISEGVRISINCPAFL